MLYALVVFCSMGGEVCVGIEDQRGPYPDVVTCEARVEEMRETAVQVVTPQMSQYGPAFHSTGRCDTLDGLRVEWPMAYEELGRLV